MVFVLNVKRPYTISLRILPNIHEYFPLEALLYNTDIAPGVTRRNPTVAFTDYYESSRNSSISSKACEQAWSI